MATLGNQAADAILRLVKQNEQLVYAAQVLGQYGSFESALEEVKSLHAKELDELTKAKAEMAAFREKSNQDKAKIRAQIDTEELKLQSVRVKADVDADSIIDEAQNKATQIIAIAHDEAASISLKSKQTLEDLETKIADTLNRLAEAQSKLGSTETALNKSEAAYSRLKDSIKRLQSSHAD